MLVLGQPGEAGVMELASRLNLPLVTTPPETPALLLTLCEERLEIRAVGPRMPGPIWVDFLDSASAQRRRGIRRSDHPLARAVGRSRPLPRIMDATAGLGRDAFVLAYLGYHVRALERSPVLFALLADGLRRLTESGQADEVLKGELLCHQADARDVLVTGPSPEVVYLDPMFPPRKKRALVRKEMQLFQMLLGQEEEKDTEELFHLARQKASQRVVVKRPTWAPALEEKPDYSVAGQRVRFDVYLRPPT